MNLIIGHLHKLHGYELGLRLGLPYNTLGKREGLAVTFLPQRERASVWVEHSSDSHSKAKFHFSLSIQKKLSVLFLSLFQMVESIYLTPHTLLFSNGHFFFLGLDSTNPSFLWPIPSGPLILLFFTIFLFFFFFFIQTSFI